MQTRLLQLAILLICLSGCTNEHTNTPAFYIWKSKLSVQDADTAYLNTLRSPKIYARMFDVDNKGKRGHSLRQTIRLRFLWIIPAFSKDSPRYIYHQQGNPAMHCR